MQRIITDNRRPDITFYASGKILLTARVVKILGIAPGDSINIARDGKEFLLYSLPKSFGRVKAACYPSKKGSRNFCCNSVTLARTILSAASRPDALKASFMAGYPFEQDSTVYLPIITARPLG